MVAKKSIKTSGSPKAEVGGIDTSAPFHSVKDAITLFGQNPANMKPKQQHTGGVMLKERQLHLAKEEASRLKELLKNAETTKDQAFIDLQIANKTIEDLTQNLKVVCDSKDSAMKATEEAKNREENRDYSKVDDGSWKLELETARAQYMAAIAELDVAKKELRKIRRDCNTLTEEKASALEQEEEAKLTTKSNMERAGQISQEIAMLQESIEQLKLASLQVKEEEEKMYADKDVQKQSYKTRLEELAKKFDSLSKEIDPALTKNLETQLAETVSEIEALRKKMDSARASDLALLKNVNKELDDAKEFMHNVFEAKGSLRKLLAGLESELENVKKEHFELMEKETETESLAGNLHLILQKVKYELEAALVEESKAKRPYEEMITSIHQVRSECENTKSEENEMKKQAEELKKETDSARVTLEEVEKKLKAALKEAEEAKAAENMALDMIKRLSERTNAACPSTSESGSHITISKDEFQFLSHKDKESQIIAEMKVTAATAQAEAVKAGENEALMKLEATQKEIDYMKTATQEALKRAEMDETAKRIVEGELRRWREREQIKAAEDTYCCVLAETKQMVLESIPHNHQNAEEDLRDAIELQAHNLQEARQSRKFDESRTSVSKRMLMRSFTGMFPMRRKQLHGGSYLPGENPVR